MTARAPLALLVFVLASPGCRKAKDDDGPGRAVPGGTYTVAGPVCVSSGKAPAYPAISYRTALYDFDAPTTRTLTVDGGDVTEAFTDADCKLTIVRRAYTNEDTTFSLEKSRHNVFEPAGCALAATVNDVTYPVSAETTTLFADKDDDAEELPYDVVETEAGLYELTSVDAPELSELWVTYGCPKADRIKLTLTPVP